MVKTVRVFLALFATLWYTTSQLNSNAPTQIWKPTIVENKAAPDYYQTS